MAVKIRLSKRGRKKLALYDIVVASQNAPRDGRFIEKVGSYNPNTSPATVNLAAEKVVQWLFNGAQPTDTVKSILSSQGILLRKHLQVGVKKGAITQEEADKKFLAWQQAKVQKPAKFKSINQVSEKEPAGVEVVPTSKPQASAKTSKDQVSKEGSKKVTSKAPKLEKVAVAHTVQQAQENTTTEQGNIIAEQELPIVAKENATAEPEPLIAAKENATAEPEPLIAAKENATAEPESLIAAKENATAEQEPLIAAKETTTAEQEPLIAAKENAIAEQEPLTAAKENAIAEQGNIIAAEENTTPEQ